MNYTYKLEFRSGQIPNNYLPDSSAVPDELLKNEESRNDIEYTLKGKYTVRCTGIDWVSQLAYYCMNAFLSLFSADQSRATLAAYHWEVVTKRSTRVAVYQPPNETTTPIFYCEYMRKTVLSPTPEIKPASIEDKLLTEHQKQLNQKWIEIVEELMSNPHSKAAWDHFILVKHTYKSELNDDIIAFCTQTAKDEQKYNPQQRTIACIAACNICPEQHAQLLSQAEEIIKAAPSPFISTLIEYLKGQFLRQDDPKNHEAYLAIVTRCAAVCIATDTPIHLFHLIFSNSVKYLSSEELRTILDTVILSDTTNTSVEKKCAEGLLHAALYYSFDSNNRTSSDAKTVLQKALQCLQEVSQTEHTLATDASFKCIQLITEQTPSDQQKIADQYVDAIKKGSVESVIAPSQGHKNSFAIFMHELYKSNFNLYESTFAKCVQAAETASTAQRKAVAAYAVFSITPCRPNNNHPHGLLIFPKKALAYLKQASEQKDLLVVAGYAHLTLAARAIQGYYIQNSDGSLELIHPSKATAISLVRIAQKLHLWCWESLRNIEDENDEIKEINVLIELYSRCLQRSSYIINPYEDIKTLQLYARDLTLMEWIHTLCALAKLGHKNAARRLHAYGEIFMKASDQYPSSPQLASLCFKYGSV